MALSRRDFHPVDRDFPVQFSRFTRRTSRNFSTSVNIPTRCVTVFNDTKKKKLDRRISDCV